MSFRKKYLISMTILIIGILIYWLFDKNIISKSNLILMIIRNYLLDGIWSISFFFFAINFSKNIAKNYILLNAIYILVISVFFEIMQLFNLINGTFDLIDIFTYAIAILFSCLIEKRRTEVKQ